jgi:hypothetical protein
MSDALRIGVGKVLKDMPPGMRSADQGELSRVGDALNTAGNIQGAAAGTAVSVGVVGPQAARRLAVASEAPSKVESFRKSRREIWPLASAFCASLIRGWILFSSIGFSPLVYSFGKIGNRNKMDRLNLEIKMMGITSILIR